MFSVLTTLKIIKVKRILKSTNLIRVKHARENINTC